jgi:hypothetical protein
VEIPLRGFVEQLAGVGEEAAFGIGGDKEGRRGRVESQALLEESCVGAAYGRPRTRRRTNGRNDGGGGREHT